MTKVEELRKKVLSNYPKIRTTIKGTDRILNIIESVDSLITAARKEGAELERKRLEALARSGGYFNDLGQEIPLPLSPAPKEKPNYYAVGDKGEGGESHT